MGADVGYGRQDQMSVVAQSPGWKIEGKQNGRPLEPNLEKVISVSPSQRWETDRRACYTRDALVQLVPIARGRKLATGIPMTKMSI
jgi:hypothetical protein